MSDLIDTGSFSVPNAESPSRASASTMRFAAGLAAATLSVGPPAGAPHFLVGPSMVRESAASLRIFDTSGQRTVMRPVNKSSATHRDFDAEHDALEALRADDRRGLVWRGIKGALGLGPRARVTTPDERVATALDRVLSVRSRGVH